MESYWPQNNSALSSFGCTEKNTERKSRAVEIYTKPVGWLEPSHQSTVRVHQAVKIGPYFHEIKKVYGMPKKFNYVPNEGDGWRGSTRQPASIGYTRMTDEELFRIGKGIQAENPNYALFTHSCQHFVDMFAHRTVGSSENVPRIPIQAEVSVRTAGLRASFQNIGEAFFGRR